MKKSQPTWSDPIPRRWKKGVLQPSASIAFRAVSKVRIVHSTTDEISNPQSRQSEERALFAFASGPLFEVFASFQQARRFLSQAMIG